jgi:aarF domain-containing kinase
VAIVASGFDPLERLRTGVRAWFQTLILRGFFHGDVHAGNFFLLRDGRIGYLDFGIVGTLDDEQKRGILEYVLGFQQGDFERVARAMMEMGAVDDPESIDFALFVSDVRSAYGPMFAPTADSNMRNILPEFIRISRKHGMRMPRNLVLVTKQLVYLDRYSRALGGDDMNVLTDKALSALIMQDMMAAMFA